MLCVVVGLAHLIPLASLFAEGVPVWVRCLIALLSLISGVNVWRIALSLHKAVLRPNAEGAQLLLPDRMVEGRVLPSSVDMGSLVVLHWQEHPVGKVRRYALLRDAFSAAEWRVLKVWVRWSVMKQPG